MGIFAPIGGWGKCISFTFLLIATLVVVGVSLSPNKTGYVDWVRSVMWMPWILLLTETMIYAITSKFGEEPEKGISVMPFGSYSPRVYIVQRWLGYHLSVIVSLILAVMIALWIGSTVQATKQIWTPVPGMFIREQIITTYSLSLFNGATPEDRAFSQGMVPSAFENPTLIFSVMFLVMIIASLIIFVASLLGMDLGFIYPIAMIVSVVIASISFPYVYHAFSYGAVEPAYTRSMMFVLITATPCVIFGTPFVLDFSHYQNNAVATMAGLVGKGQVILPPSR